MHQLFWPVVIVIVLAALAEAVGRSRGGTPRVAAKPLMSNRELAFWHLLRVAADPLHVAPQVSMGALLRATRDETRRNVRNHFDRKVVDFVLVDDSGSVRLLVELDDRTHRADRDAARDRLTASAGYATLRVTGASARDLHLLKAAVDDALGIAPSWSPPVFNPATSPHRARNTSAPPNSRRA